jgi:hypothetical protein
MLHIDEAGMRHTVMYKFRYKRNHARPTSYEEQRENHFWCHTAMNTQEHRPFRMVVEVAWSNLCALETT